MKKIMDIMNKNVQFIRSDASLREVALKMKETDSGSMPISDDQGERLLGMVTDRDLVLKAVAENRDLDTTKAKEVVTSPIVYCFDDQEIGEAARIMEIKQIRRLVVLNRQKRLVGIVSLSDIVLKGQDEHLSHEILERVTQKAQTKAAEQTYINH